MLNSTLKLLVVNMSKLGYPWIVGVYASIVVGIFLFVFWRNALFGIGTSNLIVMFVSIVIGAVVGMMISNKIIGKVCDSGFSIYEATIIGIMCAFLGSFVGRELGFLFVGITPMIYGRIPEGAGFLMLPGLMGGAIGGAIGGYSRETKTGIIGGAIGGFIASTLTGSTEGIMNGLQNLADLIKQYRDDGAIHNRKGTDARFDVPDKQQ